MVTDDDLANYLSDITAGDLPNVPFDKLPTVLATDGDLPDLTNYLSDITLADSTQ